MAWPEWLGNNNCVIREGSDTYTLDTPRACATPRRRGTVVRQKFTRTGETPGHKHLIFSIKSVHKGSLVTKMKIDIQTDDSQTS